MAAFTAGQVLTASLLNKRTRKNIARARRTTSSTATTSTTYVSVLRLDDIPLEGGKHYRITYHVHFSTSTVTDTLGALLFHTTDGSTPTTSSATLPGSSGDVDFGSTAELPHITNMTDYNPASDETLSLLLGVHHVTGTSSSNLSANGVGTITTIYIDDMGDDPGDTGVDL